MWRYSGQHIMLHTEVLGSIPEVGIFFLHFPQIFFHGFWPWHKWPQNKVLCSKMVRIYQWISWNHCAFNFKQLSLPAFCFCFCWERQKLWERVPEEHWPWQKWHLNKALCSKMVRISWWISWNDCIFNLQQLSLPAFFLVLLGEAEIVRMHCWLFSQI